MDDEHRELERELAQLRPAAPSRHLIERVDRALGSETAARPTAPRVGWWWTLPAAAALAFGILRLASDRPAPAVSSKSGSGSRPADIASDAPAASAAFKTVAAENILVSARDEGIVTLDDGTPARRERLQFVDTITWKNPRTNASLTWRVPREEVRVVPVSFY